MRIQCDACGVSHTLADEKIPNKTFKVRCRGCGLYIIRRAEPAALTGQRSDNSVLFSLEGLMGMPAPMAAGAGSGRASLSLSKDNSGLIDIRAMRAMIDERTAAQEQGSAKGSAKATAPAEIMPSFAGAGLDGLTIEPVMHLAGPPATSSRAPARPRQPLGLMIALGVLSLGVLGLGAKLVLDQPQTEVVTVVGAAPADAVDAVDPADAVDEVDEVDAVDPAASEVEPAASEVDPSEQPAIAATAPSKPKPRNRERRRESSPEPSPVSAPAPAPSKPASNDIDVDCLLDGNCKTKPSKPAPVAVPSKPSADLPAKLDSSQILGGVGPVKTAAKSCGSGTTVAVKFSVEGATGKVISAQALDEHAGSSVGKCVVTAAKQASFARFGAKQQGFTFKFRL